MVIKKTEEDATTVLALKGALDSEGEDQLRAELKRLRNKTSELVLDFREVKYVTSAGLRALLCAQKKMNRKGTMRTINVPDSVWETFELRGFEDILYIDRLETDEADETE